MKSKAANGFTLIELVTAIVIVALLGAVAVPRLFDHQVFDERGYVNELAFTLRYAQKVAAASQCAAAVTIDNTGYSAAQQAACNAGGWTVPVLHPDGNAVLGAPPPRVSVTPVRQIVFDGNGGIANGAPPVFTTNSGVFTLSIDATGGVVSVQP